MLKIVILSNNYIGGGQGERDCFTYFLENFLLELQSPEQLDLSNNIITDEALYPIVKYLFANRACMIESLNLDNNSFTNYARRTIAQAYLRCSNSKLKLKLGPMPLT